MFKKIIIFLVVIFFIAGAGAAAGFFVSVSGKLPDVTANITPNASSRIYDTKGRLITTVHAEENRIPVPISEVPKNLQNAFVAAEDVRFYEHHGVDPRGILRAIWANVVSGNATGQGGSTITQQLARNAFLTQEQTLKRKLLEVVLAFEIESKYTKQQILEMYMNQIYFGQGCYGIQTASRVYFGKDVKDLSLAQCALLAGLPNSPNYYSPFRSVEAAKYRQAIVLDQMAKYRCCRCQEGRPAPCQTAVCQDDRKHSFLLRQLHHSDHQRQVWL
jgi:penicillin-binding protein 1A